VTGFIITATAFALLAYMFGVYRGSKKNCEEDYERGYHAAIEDGWAQFNNRNREGL
jgi:hypothetical protein